MKKKKKKKKKKMKKKNGKDHKYDFASGESK